MAEDPSDIIEPMNLHPCDTPRGMLYYDMQILTKEQQTKLNTLKIQTIRDNQQYLAAHPEIRACVSIITRLVMRQRPRTNLHETIAEYFATSKLDIESEIREYIKRKRPREGMSEMGLFGSGYDWESAESEEEIETSAEVLMDIHKLATNQESEMWKTDIPTIDVASLQMKFSDSLRNIDMDYEEIPKMSPDTIIHSISVVTQADEDSSTRFADRDKVSAHVKGYLQRLEGQEEDSERAYSGHIPTISDYDAGYGRRRQTYISDYSENEQPPTSQEVLHYLREVQSDKDRPWRQSSGKQSDTDITMLPIAESETKNLMEKRSVHISESNDGQLPLIQRRSDSETHKRIMVKKKDSVTGRTVSTQRNIKSPISETSTQEIKDKSDKTISFQLVQEETEDGDSTQNSLFKLEEGEEEGMGEVSDVRETSDVGEVSEVTEVVENGEKDEVQEMNEDVEKYEDDGKDEEDHEATTGDDAPDIEYNTDDSKDEKVELKSSLKKVTPKNSA